MKVTLFKVAIFSIAITMFFSCSKDEPSALEGEQSVFGEVGNEIDWIAGQFGMNDSEITVTELKNGVSTFSCSSTLSDEPMLELLKMMPTNIFAGNFDIIGNTLGAEVNAKVTNEGAQVIFEDGTALTLVKYDAEVGDIYTAKVNGVTLKNEVVGKSTEDDYLWGGILIKVITVKYNSHTPGVLYVEHVYNHKFGLVGLAVYFEDGSVKYAGAYC